MVSRGDQAQRRELYQELNREARFSSSLTILFSQAVAERIGVHSTDIETMDLLHLLGPMTAGKLSEVTGLTTGATTRLIDRMERAGFVRRTHDTADRRRVIVEVVMENADRILPLFAAMGKRMGALWSEYNLEQLRVIADYFRKTNLIMSEENVRLRAQSAEGEE